MRIRVTEGVALVDGEEVDVGEHVDVEDVDDVTIEQELGTVEVEPDRYRCRRCERDRPRSAMVSWDDDRTGVCEECETVDDRFY